MIKHDVVLFYLADSIGDKFCHDVLNNKKCNFDGNDCCGEVVNTNVCQQCACKNTMNNITHKKIAECPPDLKILLGNEQCDDEANTPR